MTDFKTVWERKARKELLSLPRDLARRIGLKIKKLGKDPYEYSEPLKKCIYRKIRVGEYRVIIKILSTEIKVMFIGHRKNIYKRFL